MNDEPGGGAVDLTDRAVYAEWTRDIIRFGDLDPNGHVNNGAINQYFEDGRVHFRRARMTGVGLGTLAGFAIVRYSATYRAALHFPGEVEIGTVVTRTGRSSFDLGQGIFQGERCFATAEVVAVVFDRDAGRAVPLSEALRDVLEAAMAAGQPR